MANRVHRRGATGSSRQNEQRKTLRPGANVSGRNDFWIVQRCKERAQTRARLLSVRCAELGGFHSRFGLGAALVDRAG